MIFDTFIETAVDDGGVRETFSDGTNGSEK